MRKYLGLCYYGKDYIEIDPNQYESEILVTLMHELVHFMVENIITGRFAGGKVDKDCEETKIVDVHNPKSKKQAKQYDKLEEKLCEDIAHYTAKKIHTFLMKHKVK